MSILQKVSNHPHSVTHVNIEKNSIYPGVIALNYKVFKVSVMYY